MGHLSPAHGSAQLSAEQCIALILQGESSIFSTLRSQNLRMCFQPWKLEQMCPTPCLSMLSIAKGIGRHRSDFIWGRGWVVIQPY